MAVDTAGSAAPTVADLGRLVKRRYPAYAHIDDVELGRRVKAKYPAYSRYADVDDAPAEASPAHRLAQHRLRGAQRDFEGERNEIGPAGPAPPVPGSPPEFVRGFRGGPAGPAPPVPGSPPEFVRGFRGGLVGQNVESAGRTLQAAAELVPGASLGPGGYPGLTEGLRQVARRAGGAMIRAGQGQAQAPKVASYKDVKSARELFDYLQFSAGQAIASTVPSVATGAVGLVAGGPPGAAIGAAVPSYTLNFGDVAQEVDAAMPGASAADRAATSAVIAIPVTALDVIPGMKFASKAVKKLLVQKVLREAVKRGLLQRVLKEGAKGMTVEGSTEALQETIQALSVAGAAGKATDMDEMVTRAVDAAIGGALAGGAIGGGIEAIPQRGGVGPYAESLARKALGEDVEMPQMQDMVATMAKRGGAPREAAPQKPEAPTTPAAPSAPAPVGAPPTPGSAARGMAVQPEIPLLQRTQQRAAFVSRLPSEHRPVVLGIVKGLDDTVVNPFDNGQTALQGALARIEAGAAAAKTPDAMRKLAAKARKQVKGLQFVNETMSEQPGGTPVMRQVAKATADRWSSLLAGKPVTLTTEEGKPVSGRVSRVANYPYPGIEKPFRVLLADEATGQLAPLMFKSPTEFRERIVKPMAPQTELPVAGVEESTPTVPQTGGPARMEVGGGKEAASGPQRAVVKEQAAKGGPAKVAQARPPERVETPAPQPPSRAGVSEEQALSMSHEELVAAHEAERAHERGSLVRVFGEQGAKRYNQLDRLRNSSYAKDEAMDAAQREIEQMEAGLTEDQQRDLFGIDEPGLSEEQLRAAVRTSDAYLELANETDARLESAIGLSFLGKHMMGDLPDRIRMARVMQEVQQRGWSAERVERAIKAAAAKRGIEPEDAKILVRAAMERAASVAPVKKKIAPKPSGQEAKGGAPLRTRPAAPAGPVEAVEHPPTIDVALAEVLGAKEHRAEFARLAREGASDGQILAAISKAFGAGGGSGGGRFRYEYGKKNGAPFLRLTKTPAVAMEGELSGPTELDGWDLVTRVRDGLLIPQLKAMPPPAGLGEKRMPGRTVREQAAAASSTHPLDIARGVKHPERIDEAIASALSLGGDRKAWARFIRGGATDDEVRSQLVKDFGAGGGDSGVEYGVRKGQPFVTAAARIGGEKVVAEMKKGFHVEGNDLVRRVRDGLLIPEPQPSPEAIAGSARTRRQAEVDAGLAFEGAWQRLMNAAPGGKDALVEKMTHEQRQQALARLRAAPGSDPAAMAALEKAAAPKEAPAHKFKRGEEVLVPYEGRSKKRISDRGSVVGYTQQSGGKEMVHVRVTKTGKTKFNQRTVRHYDRFVEEGRIRRRAKPDNRPLDQKLGPVYRRMTLEAMGEPEVAAQIVERAKVAEEQALNAEHGGPGDPAYNRARAKWQRAARTTMLAEQVQREAESGPSEGSGLREVFAAVRATQLDRDARSYLAGQLESGRVETVADVASAARAYRLVLKAAKNPKALSFPQVHNAIGRITVAVDRAAGVAKDTKAAIDRIKDASQSKEQVVGLRAVLKSQADRLVSLRRIQSDAQARVAAASELEGAEVGNELFRVREWIDKELSQTPDDWGGSVSFMGTGEFGRWLGRLVQRGVPNAVKRLRRNARKGERDVRVVNDRGEELARYSMDEALGDPFTESALMRTAALLRLTGAREAFPPKLARLFQQSYAIEAMLGAKMHEKVEQALGGREGLAYFGKYGTGAKELAKALEGKPHNIPERFRGAIARYKLLTDEIHEMEVKHADDTGQERPKYRKDYGFAHISEGTFSGPVARMAKIMSGGLAEPSKAEITDRENRFYNRREGDPNYVKDATVALEQRIHEMNRKLAYDRFLLAAEKYLNSESVMQGGGIDSKKPTGEAIRAGLTAAHIRAALFRRPDWLTQVTDWGLQHLFFSQLTRGAQPVPLESAASATGVTTEDMSLLGLKSVYWVPGGVEMHIPKEHVVLATKQDGSRYIGLREGHVYSLDSPLPRKFVYDVIDIVTDKFARATFQLRRGREADLRHRAKVNDWVRRLERNPTDIMVGLWTSGNSRALMGYNVRAAHVNTGSTLITTLPEYGLSAYLAGLRGASKMVQRRGLRLMIDAKERAGFISSADAKAAREAIPVLREEIFAEAAGVQQGEIQVLERRMQDMMEGKDPDFSRVVNATGPFGMFSAAEGWNRTVSIVAAHAYAIRLGTPEATQRIYQNSQAAHEAMVKAIGIGNSAEAFAAMGVGVDQFSYNPLGQPLWYTGAWGRLVGQLGTWPLNNAKNYVLRTTAGAVNVARASARGFVDLAAGGRLGRKGKPKLEFDYQGGFNPPPKNWFEAWLDYNGASYSQRHAGAVFVQQMAISAVLVGFTDLTNVNVAVYGVNPVFVAGLWLLTRFFPNNEALLRWLKHGAYGATIQVGRGILPWPLSAAGPTVSVLIESGREAVQAKKRYERTGDLWGSFPWESVLKIVRRQFLTGEVELRRVVTEHPEKFAQHPWLFDFLDIKYAYLYMTKGQILKHQTGLMTESEEKQARVRVAK